MTGQEGKEVITEIEKNLPRLYTVLKVCVCVCFFFNDSRQGLPLKLWLDLTRLTPLESLLSLPNAGVPGATPD